MAFGKIFMKKQIIWGTFFVGIVGILAFGTNVYAAEHEATMVPAELTEQEKQEKLAQIAQQLAEVEREVNRLSLLVAKLALQEQALALEQQLKMAQAGGTIDGEVDIETGEPAANEGESPSLGVDSTETAQEASAEDVFASVSLEDEEQASEGVVGAEDEDGSRGFLAALGPIGNLQTPELAALAILAFLSFLILVRRLRERKKPRSAPERAPMRMPGQQQPETPLQPPEGILHQ